MSGDMSALGAPQTNSASKSQPKGFGISGEIRGDYDNPSFKPGNHLVVGDKSSTYHFDTNIKDPKINWLVYHRKDGKKGKDNHPVAWGEGPTFSFTPKEKGMHIIVAEAIDPKSGKSLKSYRYQQAHQNKVKPNPWQPIY